MFRTENEFKIVDEPKHEESELASLQNKFLEALMGNMGRGFSTVLKISQDGTDRLFYVIKRGAKTVEPLKTSETLLCLRDDFQVYNIQRTVMLSPNSLGGRLDHCFTKVDPEKMDLSGDEAGKLVKRIIEGKE